ncbi:glutamate-aspartate carrier protein [Basidiobolus meristosporus CBS 931.73]|uniref:Amino acid transporter n=1 Tax=Basidiobolus meristosporus CBS 931.73 TaxID=1314790 RepID=A0A1Y1YME9_9FUNG|nr:glutamate-aspartate carrier protein [Basidiobolus meristosporus CBS 931.73]|eukprot:ORX99175.1 glutamate-aspartate carrier protein [Basidiobolus meristosporus CBS 931.73]
MKRPTKNPLVLAWRFLTRLNLTVWIMVSMVVGILLGWLQPDFAKELKPISNIFLYMIKCLIVPLIFATLAVGIAGHGDDMKQIGRLAIKSLVYFEVVTTLALVVGLIMVNLLKPGVGVTLPADADTSATQDLANYTFSWQNELEHIVPQSFFEAAANNEVLQIVFCSIMFAVAMMKTPGKSKVTMIDWLESLSDIMFKVTELVMNFAPVGIGCSIAYTIGQSGIGVLVDLGKLMGTLYLSLIIFMLLVFVPIILILRVPIPDLLRAIAQPALIAFSTSSSEAALPRAMKNMEAYGVPHKIIAFVMPTGYSFNLDGTTLYLAIASVFCAQVGGIDMPFSTQIIMMLTLMLTSKGVAAVPRASLVILSGAVKSFNLPEASIALILGIDALMDMGRTTVNLIGNCIATVVVAKWEREFRVDAGHALEISEVQSLELGEEDKIEKH